MKTHISVTGVVSLHINQNSKSIELHQEILLLAHLTEFGRLWFSYAVHQD